MKSWISLTSIKTRDIADQINFFHRENYEPFSGSLVLHQTNDGTYEFSKFLEQCIHQNLVEKAKFDLSRFVNRNNADKVSEIILVFQNLLNKLDSFGDLPILHAYEVDDHSSIIEWKFPNIRLGFFIDEDFSKSSWHLVSKKDLGNIDACGSIYGQNLNDLLTMLVIIVLIKIK